MKVLLTLRKDFLQYLEYTTLNFNEACMQSYHIIGTSSSFTLVV